MKKHPACKRIMPAVLAFTLLVLPLSACGGGKTEEKLSEYVYVPQYTDIVGDVSDVSSPTLSGDTIYFYSTVPYHMDGTPLTDAEKDAMNNGGNIKYASSSSEIAVASDTAAEPAVDAPVIDYSDITYKPALFAVNKDGTNYRQLSDYAPKMEASSKYSYVSLDRMLADAEGNLWVAESVSTTVFDLPEGFDETKDDPYQYYVRDDRANYIRKLSDTGAELSTIDLSTIVTSTEQNQENGYYFYLGGMACDKAGNLYFTDGNKSVYVLEPNGSLRFKLDNDGYLGSLTQLKDGSVCVMAYGDEGASMFKVVDANTKSWGTQYKMPVNAYDSSSGGALYDLCYNDSTSLFGYNVATETSEKILSWINCDVDGSTIRYSTILDDGNVFALSTDYNDSGKSNFEIINFVKTPRSEVKQKTTLTLATMWLDYNLKKEILKFNKGNENYRIEVQDYSEYNTQEDYTAGITKFNTEIISGNIPDLIDISQLPYKQYAAKGLLEDFYAYLDKDDSPVKRADFVQSILKASEIDGKLYALATSFSINSIIGAPAVVGDEMGWTVDEMQQIVSEHPDADVPFGMYMTRDGILQSLCMLNMSDYIDWQTGQCAFNTDDFKSLLTFVKSFPEQIKEDDNSEYIDDATLIQDGRELFQIFSASDFNSFQYYKATFGGAITFKGFPNENRNGNVAQLNGGLAMTTSCKDKDGAWQFISALLSEDYQKNLDWYFPIIQKAFDQKLAKAMEQQYTTDENGNKVPVSTGGMGMGDGAMVEFYAISQEEADQIKALINSVEYTSAYDQKAYDIISEEAAYFFSGEKTVDKTAEIIQNRISLYINEQR